MGERESGREEGRESRREGGRAGERERGGKDKREREEGRAGIPVMRGNVGERSDERKREVDRARERKTFLLPPLLATEAISVTRRRKKRGEGRVPERGRRNFPPPSP